VSCLGGKLVANTMHKHQISEAIPRNERPNNATVTKRGAIAWRNYGDCPTQLQCQIAAVTSVTVIRSVQSLISSSYRHLIVYELLAFLLVPVGIEVAAQYGC
jgi:hypothetical protein